MAKGSFTLVAGCCKFAVDYSIAGDKTFPISMQKHNCQLQAGADLQCSVNQPLVSTKCLAGQHNFIDPM